MPELFTGTVDIQTAGSQITITLNGDNGDVAIGGNGQTGDVSVRDATGTQRVRIDGATGTVSTRSGAQVLTISLDGSSGDVVLRGVNVPGQGSPRIRLLASEGNIWLGGNGRDGDLVMFRAEGDNSTLNQATIHLDGQSGTLSTRSTAQVQTISLDGSTGDVILRGVNTPGQGAPRIRVLASEGNIWLGGNGRDGDLVLFPREGDNSSLNEATIHLDAQRANIRCGGGAGATGGGNLLLFPAGADLSDNEQATIHMNGADGSITVGAITFSDGSTQTSSSPADITAVVQDVRQDIVNLRSRVLQLEQTVTDILSKLALAGF